MHKYSYVVYANGKGDCVNVIKFYLKNSAKNVCSVLKSSKCVYAMFNEVSELSDGTLDSAFVRNYAEELAAAEGLSEVHFCDAFDVF